MILFDRTLIKYSNPAIIDSNATLMDEGQALVLTGSDSNGTPTVKPSEGAVNEIFYGISLFERRVPPFMWREEFFTINEDEDDIEYTQKGLITTSGNYNTWILDGENWSADNSDTTLSSDKITIDSSNIFAANEKGRIQFRYKPTVVEQQTIIGTTIPRSAYSLYGAQISVGRQGIYYTSYFKPDIYTVGNQLELGDEGVFQLADSGDSDTGEVNIKARVTEPPSKTNSFLGIEIYN